MILVSANKTHFCSFNTNGYISSLAVIDHILGEYDKDKDGYISFYEYMQVKVKYGTTGGT